jgi:hypothetical protein
MIQKMFTLIEVTHMSEATPQLINKNRNSPVAYDRTQRNLSIKLCMCVRLQEPSK